MLDFPRRSLAASSLPSLLLQYFNVHAPPLFTVCRLTLSFHQSHSWSHGSNTDHAQIITPARLLPNKHKQAKTKHFPRSIYPFHFHSSFILHVANLTSRLLIVLNQAEIISSRTDTLPESFNILGSSAFTHSAPQNPQFAIVLSFEDARANNPPP